MEGEYTVGVMHPKLSSTLKQKFPRPRSKISGSHFYLPHQSPRLFHSEILDTRDLLHSLQVHCKNLRNLQCVKTSLPLCHMTDSKVPRIVK